MPNFNPELALMLLLFTGMNPWPWLFFLVGWVLVVRGLFAFGLPVSCVNPLGLLGWLFAWVFFWQW